jgi:CelD/BcsL family acetyltransferase involved in cellulose biosynthesis
MSDFDKLRARWNFVYAADRYAHVFSSWAWLRSFLPTTPFKWLVLVCQPDGDSDPVAFLPITMETRRFNLLRTLRLGGAPTADYTGFLALPERQEEALAALAKHIQAQLPWDRFWMKDVLDPRLELFAAHFSRERLYVLKETERISCPYLPLPSDWNEYLKASLGRRTREHLRRRLRQLEKLEGFQAVHINKTNAADEIDTLLRLWQSRWGLATQEYRSLLLNCFENGCLHLIMLRQGSIPIAGIAGFVDKQRQTFYYFISGYNEDYAKYSPGRVIVGYSIRFAIENGFQNYDFLRGEDLYKFEFGALQRYNRHVLIQRRSLRSSLVNQGIHWLLRIRSRLT